MPKQREKTLLLVRAKFKDKTCLIQLLPKSMKELSVISADIK